MTKIDKLVEKYNLTQKEIINNLNCLTEYEKNIIIEALVHHESYTFMAKKYFCTPSAISTSIKEALQKIQYEIIMNKDNKLDSVSESVKKKICRNIAQFIIVILDAFKSLNIDIYLFKDNEKSTVINDGDKWLIQLPYKCDNVINNYDLFKRYQMFIDNMVDAHIDEYTIFIFNFLKELGKIDRYIKFESSLNRIDKEEFGKLNKKVPNELSYNEIYIENFAYRNFAKVYKQLKICRII